jgi:2-keto-3-deoxy-L-rhamnonate aldolase RhmA
MIFFFITNSIELASFAVENGADRIFVDLEILGKVQRQGHLNTVISRHSMLDVAALRPYVPSGSLMVRINPVHEGTRDEVDQVIAAGADIIMLPMFRGSQEVEVFTQAVAGRARTCLLVETVGAMESLAACIAVPGVDEVHIGLNDLHLELGRRFMFEPLIEGLVDTMAATLNAADIPFGIGGVARVSEGLLPAELILAEHVRLGSTAAILSRTFHRQATSVAEIRAEMDFSDEIRKLRTAYAHHLSSSKEQLQALQQEVSRRVLQIAEKIRPATTSAPTGE